MRFLARSLHGSVLFVVVALGSLHGQEVVYHFDQEQSAIAFQATHLGVLTVNGHFNSFKGKMVFYQRKPQSIDCSIAVKSIDTNDKLRDENLRDVAYFDVKSHPWITFHSNTIVVEKGNFKTQGILQVKNTIKKVMLEFITHFSKDQKQLLLKAEVLLNRKDFDLDFGAMDALVGEEITIIIRLLANGNNDIK